MKYAEWVLTCLALVISGVFIVESFALPRLAADPGGLRLLPQIFAGGIALAAGALLIGLALRDVPGWFSARGTGSVGVAAFDPEASRTQSGENVQSRSVRLAVAALLTVLFPLAMTRVGFLLAVFLYALSLLLCLRTPILRGVLFAGVLATSLYLIFGQLLNSHLPPGTWLQLS